MPIPSPNKGESQKDYISRCMGNEALVKEYPDTKQRAAICYSTYRDKDKKKSNSNFIALSAEIAETRVEKFLDQDHLIVPVVALLEQVLHSSTSDHPELALSEEFGKLPSSWNGRPVVVNHPEMNGEKVSANIPSVLEGEMIGNVFNTKFEDDKLKMEAWINLDRVEKLGGEIAETVKRLQEGEMTEVSTGLFADVEKKEGEFKGKKFNGIWRNIVPDHLAILSDSIGACSVEDGCGAPRANACGVDCECENCVSKLNSEEKHSALKTFWEVVKDIPRFFENKKYKGDKNKRAALQAALTDKFGYEAYLGDVFDNNLIYSTYSGHFSVDYTIGDDGTITLGKKSTPVIPQMSFVEVKTNAKTKKEGGKNFPSSDYAYVPDPEKPSTWKLRLTKTPGGTPDAGIVGAAIAALGKGFRGQKVQIPSKDRAKVIAKVRAAWRKANPEKKTSEMPEIIRSNSNRSIVVNKEEFITALIANESSKFDEDDREWLLALEEEQLEKLEPAVADDEEDTSASQEDAAEENDETDPMAFLEKAPAPVKDFFNEGLRLQSEKRTTLIKKLVDNKKNKFTEAELQVMGTEYLEKLVDLSVEAEDYSGRGGPRTQSFAASEAPPPPPKVFTPDYLEKKRA